MKILGIESSCDETSAAVVEDGFRLLSNVVASSMDLHVQYGGVVPEIAARSHIEAIIPVIDEALTIAECTWDDIDGIAVTHGAGLSGSLLIGVMAARTLAIIHNKPLYGANHVLGHVYANFITESPLPEYQNVSIEQPEFPMLAVIVSGKHSELVVFQDHFKYELLGETQDDAIGEAFDKVAKMLGLPYPGGPSVSKAALTGDPLKYKLPKARVGRYDFSFSGLKTAVLRLAQSEIGEKHDFPSFKLADRLTEQQKADIAASFQYTAAQTIVEKAAEAIDEYRPKSVVLAGGVAANQELRAQLSLVSHEQNLQPPINLCTDNAAMIAALGYYMAQTGTGVADPFSLHIEPALGI